MNEEIRKQIDGLESHYWPCPKCNGIGSTLIDEYYEPCSNCEGNGSIADMVIMKSDVIELVDRLTKWNKVEDCLPEKGLLILTRNLNNHIEICTHDGVQFVNNTGYVGVTITEWKPII